MSSQIAWQHLIKQAWCRTQQQAAVMLRGLFGMHPLHESIPALMAGCRIPYFGAGHIVTNFHVIRGASEVQVSLIDQSTYPAKIVGGEWAGGRPTGDQRLTVAAGWCAWTSPKPTA